MDNVSVLRRAVECIDVRSWSLSQSATLWGRDLGLAPQRVGRIFADLMRAGFPNVEKLADGDWLICSVVPLPDDQRGRECLKRLARG